MRDLPTRFERFLRIDRFTAKSKLMRARAVYMMGLAFIFTQAINLVSMTYTYGGFTFDHIVSLAVCALVTLTILTLRRSDNFKIYALTYSVLIVAGTMSSALNQNTGINSALIPFFLLGVIVNGFICGWRTTSAFGAFAVISIWFLWGVSSNYSYTPIFDVENFANRNFQRAIQASLATILITMVAAFFSKNMHEAFSELEAGIQAAQESDRAKTDFLSTMSHELCTPMNGIIGMNEAMQETDLDEEQKEISEVIGDSGRDLQTIITNVLLFSQLDGGRIVLDDSAFDLPEALIKSAMPYRALAATKGLQFNINISPDIPKLIIGDELRTVQVAQALLDNAIKFTDQGTIELSVRQNGQLSDGTAEILIAVTDTGIGVEEAHRRRIFERFTQQDGSITRRYGGTGLGLTIVKGLTQLMGGDVLLSSNVGAGSSFGVKIEYKIPGVFTESQWQEAAE